MRAQTYMDTLHVDADIPYSPLTTSHTCGIPRVGQHVGLRGCTHCNTWAKPRHAWATPNATRGWMLRVDRQWPAYLCT